MSGHATIERLSAFVDGELHGLRRRLLARHLRGCGGCAARVAELELMRSRLQSELRRHPAPPELRQRVPTLIADLSTGGARERGARRARVPGWPWLVGSALAGSVITLTLLLVVNLVVGRIAARDIVAEAVADHVRATLGQHPIEVASADRHTVKPWLAARLDYSPPVQDLAAEGFELLGGRIDRLRGERVATLVYRHRLHLIDVFVRPLPAAAPKAPRRLRGFNVAHASGGGMDFLAVSDVEADVLNAFLARLTAETPAR